MAAVDRKRVLMPSWKVPQQERPSEARPRESQSRIVSESPGSRHRLATVYCNVQAEAVVEKVSQRSAQDARFAGSKKEPAEEGREWRAEDRREDVRRRPRSPQRREDDETRRREFFQRCDGRVSKASRQQQIAWSFEITDGSATAESILDLFERHGPWFEARTLATAAHRVGKYGEQRVRGDWRLGPLAEACARLVGAYKPRELANVARGFAKMGFVDRALYSAIAAETAARVRDFGPRDMADVLWSFANVGIVAPDFFFEAVAEEASLRLDEFNAQDVANAAWALAKAGARARTFFEAAARDVPRRIYEFAPQEMTNVAWAFATVGFVAPRLLEAVAVEAQRRFRDLNPRDLVNTAWALATANCSAPALFVRIAQVAAKHMRQASSQDMAMLLWALAKVEVSAPAVFEAVAVEAPSRTREFTSQGLANIVWAFATAGFVAPRLFEAVAAEALRRLKARDFNARDMASTLWAFATAGVAAEPLFAAISLEASRRVADFNAHSLATTIWAFAAVGWDQRQTFIDLGAPLAAATFDGENLSLKWQLTHVVFYVRHRWPHLDLPLSRQLPSFQSSYCSSKHGPDPSRFQRQVSKTLEQMGWKHTFEHQTAEGFSLDVAQPEAMRAIEVDGPTHFLQSIPTGKYVVNGATRFKSETLRMSGWQVAHVPFYSWDGRSDQERRLLLADTLKQITADTGS